MKIFYAVQATGNGHISRAMEILPYLKKYGEVDIFLSGSNSGLPLNDNVKYRSKGLSLFYSGTGGLSYRKIAGSLAPLRICNEVKHLPVEKYDLVLNDFESITSLACRYKKVKSINFGHQASFMSSKVPRPGKHDLMGEFILKNYARASKYIGLHFENYDDFILPPVVKKEIWNAEPVNKNYITVYLLSYSDAVLKKYLSPLTNYRFEVFSKEVKCKTVSGNITFIPVDKDAFNKSMIGCEAIITGAGFETPAEALYLNKKIMAIPVKGQYEQACNAAALDRFGVKIITDLSHDFESQFNQWILSDNQIPVNYFKDTRTIISNMMERATVREDEFNYAAEGLLWE